MIWRGQKVRIEYMDGEEYLATLGEIHSFGVEVIQDETNTLRMIPWHGIHHITMQKEQ